MPKTSRLLRFEPLTVVDVPFQVLENAHWRPSAAKLTEKEKKKMKGKVRGKEKDYQRLRAAWLREETWINHALNALLASVPDRGLARLLGDLCSGTLIDNPELAKLDDGGISSTTGAPDFIVLGDGSCVLGESKVDAHEKSARYDFPQFTKYQMLGLIVSCARDPAIRRQAAHLLIVPELSPGTFCKDHQQWWPGVDGRRLVVDPARMAIRDKNCRFRDFNAWRAFVQQTLLADRVLKRCDLDVEEVKNRLAVNTPVVVPTFVVTWSEMMMVVRRMAENDGLRGIARAATRLEKLAYGPGGPRADEFAAVKAI